MKNDFLKLTDTKVNIQQAENLLSIIESKRKDAETKKEVQSESSVFSDLFKAFKDFFSRLGKPTIQKRLLKAGSPARSSDYNDTMTEIDNDIHVAYGEVDSLSSAVVKDFNYSEAERQGLLNRVRKLSSDVIDYSLYASGAKSQSIYASDSFTDSQKIDYSFVGAGFTPAQLVTSQGLVTLHRNSNIDRNPLVRTVLGVRESIPVWDVASETGGYEGLYFGLKNEARPEGGVWHISYSEDGQRLYEHGTDDDGNMPNRLKMFDNNPDTFWEVELNTPVTTGYRNTVTGQQISVSEFNQLVNNEITSPSVNTIGGTVTTGETGSLVERYVPVAGEADGTYLRCSFVVNLAQNSTINWISLNPMNFGHSLFLEVLSIQTSEDGKSFTELEGFDDHEYETTITDRANSELNPTEVQAVLSTDKFKYAGMGIWTFAPRTVKSIKFDLRQMRSYIKDYDVVMVELEQTVTTTTQTSSWFGLKKSSSTSSQTFRKNVEVPYLTGVIAGYDVMSLEAGSTTTSMPKPNVITPVITAALGAVAGGVAVTGALYLATIGTAAFPVVGTIIGAIIGYVLGSLWGSKKSETTVSPTKINRQWTQTKSDRSRFAIGVRDINLYAYSFSEKSEVVSIPWVSPAPISRITLSVDEQIPKAFYSDSSRAGTENDWIKYYISVNNGASWTRISPITHKLTMSEDGVNPVPEIVYINSEITGSSRTNPLAYIDSPNPVYEVRFKAALSRPTTMADADSYTPVLMQYALQIYPLGGL
jgi:hypothetical protein